MNLNLVGSTYVLSSLKAEWTVSDTDSAHWASSLILQSFSHMPLYKSTSKVKKWIVLIRFIVISNLCLNVSKLFRCKSGIASKIINERLKHATSYYTYLKMNILPMTIVVYICHWSLWLQFLDGFKLGMYLHMDY